MMIVEPMATDAKSNTTHSEGFSAIVLIVIPPHNISNAVALDFRDTPCPFS